MQGYVHSVETSGMVDGPGIRYVIFMQGCLLRCQFCHNPDTWEQKKGNIMTVSELVEDIESYIPYLKHSNGGVTVSGGEPLLQIDFLIELFKQLKKLGLHTTIDSSGGCASDSPTFLRKLDELLQYTDLILLDLKQMNPEKHKKLTSIHNSHILNFAKLLCEKNQPVWIRHVLIPTVTDDEEDLRNLGAFIKQLKNVEKVELLPYHQLGVYKWAELGLEYQLAHIEPPTDEMVEVAKQFIGI